MAIELNGFYKNEFGKPIIKLAFVSVCMENLNQLRVEKDFTVEDFKKLTTEDVVEQIKPELTYLISKTKRELEGK